MAMPVAKDGHREKKKKKKETKDMYSNIYIIIGSNSSHEWVGGPM